VEIFTREILEKTASVRKQKIFVPRAQKAISYLNDLSVSRSLLVEIGGGNGLFLDAMKEMGAGFKRYLNVEASKEGCKFTRKRGFDTLNDFIENVKGLRADCVCAFEVIEHLFDPLRFLWQIKNILKKDGILIISAPNIEGFDLLLLGKDSDNVAAPNHLNYFNPGSINTLLERAGLRSIALETPGVLDVDIVRNKILAGHQIKDTFVSFFVEKSDKRTRDRLQDFLQDNNLSSNMWAVCKNAE
jgi:SAM-dependent methyltransferase